MNCENCGSPVNSDAKFCPECGGRIDAGAAPQQGIAARTARRSHRRFLTFAVLSVPVFLLIFFGIWVFSKGELSQAQKLLQQAINVAATIQNDSVKRGLFVDIAIAQGKGGNSGGAARTLQRALKLALDIQEPSDKVAAWVWIVDAYFKIDADSGAAAAFRQVFQAGVELSYSNENEPYKALAQAKIGDVKGAKQTAASMGNRENAIALYFIARAQAESGDISGARQTVAAIDQAAWRVHALLDIAASQAKSGRRADSGASLSDAFQTALLIEDDSSKMNRLLQIGKGWAEMENQPAAAIAIQEALRVAAKASPWRTKKRNPFLLARIAETQAGIGNINEAVQIANEALETLTTYPEFGSSGIGIMALLSIACVQAEKGNVSEALGIIGKIKKDVRDYALICVVMAQAKAGDAKAALQTAAAVKKDSDGANTRSITRALAKAGMVKQSLDWVANQDSSLLKTTSLLGTAEGILERIEAREAKTAKTVKN